MKQFTMELEKQVCSLKSAKTLKELNVKQNSIFWWDEGDGREDIIEFIPEMSKYSTKELISAFTSSELGELLPHHIRYNGSPYQIKIWSGENLNERFWTIGWDSFGNKLKINDKYVILSDNNESEAKARMLIFLLKNGLMP